MAIRKFSESNIISNDRVGDLINELKSILYDLQSKNDNITLYRNEFDNYKSNEKGNTHIDDSILEFQKLQKNIEDSINNLEIIINNINASNDNNSDDVKYDF